MFRDVFSFSSKILYYALMLPFIFYFLCKFSRWVNNHSLPIVDAAKIKFLAPSCSDLVWVYNFLHFIKKVPTSKGKSHKNLAKSCKMILSMILFLPFINYIVCVLSWTFAAHSFISHLLFSHFILPKCLIASS